MEARARPESYNHGFGGHSGRRVQEMLAALPEALEKVCVQAKRNYPKMTKHVSDIFITPISLLYCLTSYMLFCVV